MNDATNGATREIVYDYAKDEYGTSAEFLWKSAPNCCVFRRADNKKWYGIIMDVPKNRLSLVGKEPVDILDIKVRPIVRDIFLGQKGFLPAYHMNRENWLSVLLDGTVDKQTVFDLIDESYENANGKAKKRKPTEE